MRILHLLFKPKKNRFKWNDDKVIDFVNWYIALKKLDLRYTLENKTILESFKNGDKIEDWQWYSNIPNAKK